MAEFKTVNYTEVRLNLKSLVDECSTRGTIIFVQSKGRKVAMVPLRLLNELNYLRGAQNKDAVTKGEVVPRKELREIEAELPAEVTEPAHSYADDGPNADNIDYEFAAEAAEDFQAHLDQQFRELMGDDAQQEDEQ